MLRKIVNRISLVNSGVYPVDVRTIILQIQTLHFKIRNKLKWECFPPCNIFPHYI